MIETSGYVFEIDQFCASYPYNRELYHKYTHVIKRAFCQIVRKNIQADVNKLEVDGRCWLFDFIWQCGTNNLLILLFPSVQIRRFGGFEFGDFG